MERRRGFTLMEMLAVVAILAVAASIAVPAVAFLRDSWTMRQRNAHARTVFLTAQAQLSRLRASGGLDLLDASPEAVAQMGEERAENLRFVTDGDGVFAILLPEEMLEEGVKTAQILIEFASETGSVASVFFYEGKLDIAQGYRSGQLPRDARGRRKLLLGYCDGSDLPDGGSPPGSVKAELVFDNGQDAGVTVLVPTQTKDLGDLTAGNYTGFLEDLEIHLTVTGERGGEIRTCIKPRGTTENCRPGSTEGGMDAVAVTALLDSLRWSGSLGGGIAPGDNVSVVAEISSTRVRVESAVLPGINPLFASLTDDGSGGLRIHITNGRHLQNLNKLSPKLTRRVSAVVFTGPEGTVGKGEGLRLDWQETSEYYGGLNFTPISNGELLETADFVGNETAVCNLKIETDGDGGLFACLNTAVDSLYLVDPDITAAESAGALAARTGEHAVITNCGVFCESEGTLRGKTAGGLVGIVEHSEFTRCFAAVDVEGESAGGFAGQVSGAAFDRCYASGAVSGDCSGGFLGTGEASAFTNCFATGDAAGRGTVGGFAGMLTADEEMKFHSCYSLGRAIRGEAVFENFCGKTAGNPTGLSDYYKGYAEAVLSGTELTDYRFKDCYYLAGNYPNAAYDDGASAFWASPMDYETLGNIRASGKILLDRLLETPFESPEKLESAKTFLQTLEGDFTEILEKYQDSGTYQLYFDGAKEIYGDTTLKKTYRKAYSAAFPGRVWEIGDQPFPVLKGVPYYGAWPKQQGYGDFGILYYERLENGLNIHQIRLSDGRETASREGSGRIVEAGYGLYCKAGTRPFPEETFGLAGEEIPGILPEAYSVYALEASGAELRVGARYWGKTVTVVPEFADTLNQVGGVFKIRCQSQMENIAQYSDRDYVLEGEILLDETWQAIPEFRGTLTGTGEIRFAKGQTGLVDTLRGGSLEGIRISGKLTLFGTAGCLANMVTGGGRIRDCSVNAEIYLKNTEIFGPAVGILEDGSILRTKVGGAVSGSASCHGAFLGQALAGEVRDCEANLTGKAFAGFAAGQEATIEYATHVTPEKPESSRVVPAELEKLTGPAVAVTYRTAFENCTFRAGDSSRDALRTLHYYSLNEIGGWDQALWDASELPKTGKFLLVTEAGALLQVKNGQVFLQDRWDLSELAEEDFWTAAADLWRCRDVTATAVPGGETVTLVWREPVTVNWKTDGESELHTRAENPTRQAVCLMYEITENTDCRAVWLETVRQLYIPGEGL